MALSVTITKAVPKRQKNETDYQVPIHVEIKNEASEVLFEKDYSERWYPILDLGILEVKFRDKIKADWDTYIAEQAKYNAAQFDSLVANLKTAATTYINQ